jgi:hypothetical protein
MKGSRGKDAKKPYEHQSERGVDYKGLVRAITSRATTTICETRRNLR